MRKRRRGLAATEVTIAGATLTFLVTMIVPTIDALRTESSDIPPAEENERENIKSDEPVEVRRHFKQLAIAIHNYQGSVGPVLEDVFTTVGEDRDRDGELQDVDRLIGLNLELGENAELYRQFLATVEYHKLSAESDEDIEYLHNVETYARQMMDQLVGLQELLDMLVLSSDDVQEFETEEEIFELILRDR